LSILGLALTGCADNSKDPNSADSLYKQARALEDRPAADAYEAQRNVLAARQFYTQALEKRPSQSLEAYIHAGLGYDAYTVDDYSTAIEQYATAYPNLQDKDLKSWALLRIGISQQRLGHFDQADATLGRVMSEYPSSTPAKVAREKIGIRSFFVQLAAFTSAPTALSAVTDLKKSGLNATLASDNQGRHLLRLGPLNSYAQAQGLRSRVVDKYPDAMIIP